MKTSVCELLSLYFTWLGPLLTALVGDFLANLLRSAQIGGIEYPHGNLAYPCRKRGIHYEDYR